MFVGIVYGEGSALGGIVFGAVYWGTVFGGGSVFGEAVSLRGSVQ